MLRATRLALVSLLVTAAGAQAQWTASRPDGHAPIGVMMDHTHETGEFMLSYRYLYMSMEGLRDGTTSIDPDQVVDPAGYGFLVAPTEMSAQMHIFGLMYAPGDVFTLVGMLPVTVKSMDHVTRSAERFTTESSGIGDLKLGGMWLLEPFADQRVHVNLMLSFPIGSINERDDTPMGDAMRLPYPMQTGSGTFDATPGMTYLGQHGDWSWGGQALATFRLGENDNLYRLGHRYDTTLWGAYQVSRFLSGSLRLAWTEQENVEGADPELDSQVVPTADPDLQGFSRWLVGFGINTYVRGGTFRGLRIAAEALAPLYQDLKGPQLETDWALVIGAQYSGATSWLGGE